MSDTFTIKAGRVIGIRTSVFTIFNTEKYDEKAIPAAWQEFFKKAQGTDLLAHKKFYGATIPSMAFDAPMEYFAGALVDSNTEIPEGFESVDLPAGEYLAITHKGSIMNIASTYQLAYMQQLPASGKEMRQAPHLEVYDPQLNPMSDDYEMVIGIPIS